MSQRPVLVPDASHPIVVEPMPGRIQVFVGQQMVADTTAALALREASYPVVYYIPRSDVDASVLTASDHTTYCPYKGDAAYHGLRGPDGTILPNKVWFYGAPYPSVSEIADHVAFYDDAVRVEVTG